MSELENQARARTLARRAEADAKAMRRLASDAEIDDASVGFHAQQAIEKWIKAAMALGGLDEERSHDLGRLLELLGDTQFVAPPGADWLDDLTVYAVPMRYDELLDVEPLDRDAVVSLIGEIEDWAEDQLQFG